MKWRRLALPMLGIILAIAAAVFFSLRPKVVSLSPTTASGKVSRYTTVEVVFSREMDRESVEGHFSTTPAVPGEVSWEGAAMRFTPDEPWPAGTGVAVRLEKGARSSLGLGVSRETSWSFQVSPVLLAYLWPSKGNADLYTLDPVGEDVSRLTNSGGVLSFSVAPDGLALYYFAENSQRGSDLYRVDRFSGESERLISCQRARCSEAAVSPEGSWLAYLRNDAEVWALRLDGSFEEQRVSPSGHTANFPSWASEGVLSYYDDDRQEFAAVDLQSGETLDRWPNQAGELGDWSPNGTAFAAPEFYEVETDLLRGPTGEESNQEVDPSELLPVWVTSSQLRLYTLGGAAPASLTAEDMAEDYAPVFSPDGTRLVFTRRYLDKERWTPGRQVWLMPAAPGSGQRRQLTDAPDYEYSALAWSLDGKQLAVVRFNVTLLTNPPEIWLLALDGSGTRLVIDGFSPQWLP